MGCLIFLVSIFGAFIFYAIVLGLIGQVIINYQGLTGMDTNYVFMPIFLIVLPLLTIITASIITVYIVNKRKNKAIEIE